MDRLLRGIRRFREKAYPPRAHRFQELARGQSPSTLFITCSDSRVDPCLITQSRPGELFVIRNAGNLIPPYDATSGGAAATVEFAMSIASICDVVVCGHSDCAAMQTLLQPERLVDLPILEAWLGHAGPALEPIWESEGSHALDRLIERNVLVQLGNLCTHPSVAAARDSGAISLHAWVYDIESGQIRGYAADREQFVTLN